MVEGEAAPEGLIAGLEPPDDAAVHLVAPDLAVIGTVDFFPPIVDDPRTYGEIAAANALSDVFAMGGRVLFALSVAAIPEDLPRDAFRAILDGAASVVREAGGILAGGHTIRDPEPKYGLAVVGVAHPDRLLRKGGARPGDILVLTKPLGTGLLVSGRRGGRTSDADLAAAVDSMRRLNRDASEALTEAGVAGATDVTGFGLLGHGLEMARASGTRFVFEAAALPALDGALDLAAAGVETGGAAHNRRFVLPALTVADGVPAGARDPRPRPADIGRPSRRCQPVGDRDPRGRPRRPGCHALANRPRRAERRRPWGRGASMREGRMSKQARNPEAIHPPVGRYVHQIEVTGEGRLLFISGQVGRDRDGNVPDDPVAQFEIAMRNVLANLEAAGFDVSDLVKIVTYVVGEMDPGRRREVLDRLLGDHVTTSTLLFISALASPAYKVEVDAWAAR